jgi:succinate-acetate transporter protein
MDGIQRTARNGEELEFRVEKLARPNPLGLFGFATTTLVLGLYTCNTRYSLV